MIDRYGLETWPSPPKAYLKAIVRESPGLVRDYRQFLSDRVPDRYDLWSPKEVARWREYKLKELVSLLHRLEQIEKEWI